MVVDGHVEELPTGAASFIAGIAGDAVAGLDDTGQLLDVDVQQIAGGGVFVAHDGDFRLQHADLVQLQPGQDTADGGAAQAGSLGNADPGPALCRSCSTRSTNSGATLRGNRCGRDERSGKAARPPSR